MCTISCHRFALSSASHGRALTTFPSTTPKPCGLFIHPLTAITVNDPVRPVITIGTPVRKCARGVSRPQPYT
jgi:hypothetical protein